MKKICSVILVLSLSVSLLTLSSAAAKKAAVRKGAKPAVLKAAPAPVLAPVAKPFAPATSDKASSAWSAEVGLAGGGLSIGGVFTKQISDKLTYRGQLAYAIGNQYGVVIADLGRVTYDLGAMSLGAGLTYAMYSKLVEIPGSGTLANQNLAGVELLGTKSFNDKLTAIVGYNTALGIRASVNYSF